MKKNKAYKKEQLTINCSFFKTILEYRLFNDILIIDIKLNLTKNMENLDTKTEVISEVKLQKKNVWKIIIPAGIILIIISVILTFWFLSKNSGSLITQQNNTQKNMCAGVKIVFFPGGNETDSFASVVYGGARAAQADLGADVEYVWSDWDSNKMVSQFIDAISKSPDAIAIMGHPGEKAFGSLIDEAERKNIIVTSQNVDLPVIRAKYSDKGFGYVGQSVYDSGLMVTNALLRKYTLAEGTEVIVFGINPILNPSRYERTKGEVDGLKNGKLTVHEVTITPEVEKDPRSPAAQKLIADALAAFPNTKVIISDHGQLTDSISTHLKNLGKNPGDLIVAGFDLSAGTVAGIKNGYISLVLDQQPYLQGYLPILQSCLTKKYGFAGLYVDTGTGLIDKSNVGLVEALAEQKIR